jgi:hypothetical protein
MSHGVGGSAAVAALLISTAPMISAAEDTMEVTLRSRSKEGDVVEKPAAWDPKKTAIIICDMWDDHWWGSWPVR